MHKHSATHAPDPENVHKHQRALTHSTLVMNPICCPLGRGRPQQLESNWFSNATGNEHTTSVGSTSHLTLGLYNSTTRLRLVRARWEKRSMVWVTNFVRNGQRTRTGDSLKPSPVPNYTNNVLSCMRSGLHIGRRTRSRQMDLRKVTILGDNAQE